MNFVLLDPDSVLYQIQSRLGLEIWEDPELKAGGQFIHSREPGNEYAYIVVRDSSNLPILMHELCHALQYMPSSKDESACFLFERNMFFERSGIEDYLSSKGLPFDDKWLSLARDCLDHYIHEGEWYTYSDYPVEYLPFYISNPWSGNNLPPAAEEILLAMLADVEYLLEIRLCLYSLNKRKINIEEVRFHKQSRDKIIQEIEQKKIKRRKFLRAVLLTALILL